jgi:hypothetical protein
LPGSGRVIHMNKYNQNFAVFFYKKKYATVSPNRIK